MKEYCDNSVSSGNLDEWYVLLRNLQGELLKTLEVGYMIDAHHFLSDSLFCEWGYIVNFDTGKLEVYQGFQTKPHNKGRYAKKGKGQHKKTCGTAYYPCALVKEYRLKNLPNKKQFLADMKKVIDATKPEKFKLPK